MGVESGNRRNERNDVKVMLKRMLKTAETWMVVYVLIGFFTYGYYLNRHKGQRVKDAGMVMVEAMGMGMMWPMYWLAVIAIESTSWASPQEGVGNWSGETWTG